MKKEKKGNGQFTGRLRIPSRRGDLITQLKKVDPKSASIIERCDSQSFDLWAGVAIERVNGLTDIEIARILSTDPELIRNLVESPSFILFEAVIRKRLAGADVITQIRLKLHKAGLEAVDGLAHWAACRELPAAGASVSASKAILSTLGLATERSEKVVKKYNIGKKTTEKLLRAQGRSGA